jgi:glycerophosphoryl diester phosphodiesterase
MNTSDSKNVLSGIKLMGHRGIPWRWPENTILSYRKALDAGAEILEFDVRLSKDGVPVLMHDETLDRTTDGTGRIPDITFADLSEKRVIFTRSGLHKPGEPIPTLEETAELLKKYPDVLIMCELKDYSDRCIGKTVDILGKAHLLQRTCFDCFDYKVLEKVRAIDKNFLTPGFPLRFMSNVLNVKDAEKLFNYIAIPFDNVEKAEIDRYKAMGILVGVFVVNNPQALFYCAELGVHMVCTDQVDDFIQFRKQSAMPLK